MQDKTNWFSCTTEDKGVSTYDGFALYLWTIKTIDEIELLTVIIVVFPLLCSIQLGNNNGLENLSFLWRKQSKNITSH